MDSGKAGSEESITPITLKRVKKGGLCAIFGLGMCVLGFKGIEYKIDDCHPGGTEHFMSEGGEYILEFLVQFLEG